MSSLAPGTHRVPALIGIWGKAQLKRMWEVWQKMCQQCVLVARKAERKENYCPLLSSPADDIWSAVPGLGPLNVRNLLTNWTKCRGEPPKCLGAGGSVLGREAGAACSA